jgi:aminopeptidase N
VRESWGSVKVMKVNILFLVVLLFSALALGGSDLALFEPAMAPAAVGDLQRVGSLPQYELRLEVSFTADGPSLAGHERLDYINNEGITLNELYLRLYPNGHLTYGAGSLAISAATLDGEPVEPYLELDGTAARIALERPLPAGGSLVLELDFSGTVPQNFAGYSSYGIYDYSGGVLKLANWFPILAAYDTQGWHLDPAYSWGDAVYGETALFEVWITAPLEQIVVASGTDLDQAASVDGRVTHHYVGGPLRDFFVAMSPGFKRLTAQVGETQVNSYYLEGDEPGGRKALEIATNAVGLFDRLFGLYPFAEFDVLETPLPWAGGVEYPGVVLISDRLYGSPQYLAQQEPQFTMIVSHEVAHQWWYSLVGNDVIREPWLDEALATYSSGLYTEEFLSAAVYQGLVREWEANYEQARAQVEAPITAPLDQFYNNSIYYGLVYCGGALFYRELRATLGDQLFFTGLQEYFARFKYGVATTAELLRLFEEVSGRDLEELYDRWLFAPLRSP